MSNYHHSSTYGGDPYFVPPPQAYSAPPPGVSTQQLQRYQHGAHDNTSLAPWVAPPANPYRGDSYNSQHSHRSHRSNRSHRSRRSHYDDESPSQRHREKRPTIGDTLYMVWDAIVGAIRSPSGKR